MELCGFCGTEILESDEKAVCEKCGLIYHAECLECGGCVNCLPIELENEDYKEAKRQAEERKLNKSQPQQKQQEKEQNNTEVKSNQEDCVNHESTNQPKTNISVQHEHSKKNIVSGIVFIVLGVIMILHSTGRSGGFAAFGGDFYTEIHEQVSLVVSNLHSIAIILKDGFGFLFIGLGVDRLIKK